MASGWQLRHRPHSGLSPPRYMPCPAYKKEETTSFFQIVSLDKLNKQVEIYKIKDEQDKQLTAIRQIQHNILNDILKA